MPAPLTMTVLKEELSIARFFPDQIPAIPLNSETFFSMTVTEEELSLVCPARNMPKADKVQTGFMAIKVEGPLDFSLTGILADISGTLAKAGISIFALSTFDTDYVLVRTNDLDRTVCQLEKSGHIVTRQDYNY